MRSFSSDGPNDENRKKSFSCTSDLNSMMTPITTTSATNPTVRNSQLIEMVSGSDVSFPKPRTLSFNGKLSKRYTYPPKRTRSALPKSKIERLSSTQL